MPATQTQSTVADWGQLQLSQGSNQTLSALPNSSALDLLQIFNEGGKCVINVTSLGVVNLNPVSSTGQCIFGRYFTTLTGSPTIAQYFANAFTQNTDQQDVLQIRGQGGNGIFHVDYLGVAYSS